MPTDRRSRDQPVKSEPLADAPDVAGPAGPWSTLDRLFCADTCAGFAAEFAAAEASPYAIDAFSRSSDFGVPPFSVAVA